MTEKFDEKKATDWLIKAEETYKINKIVIDLKEKLLNMNSDSQNGEIKNHEAFLISLLVRMRTLEANLPSLLIIILIIK
jgi:hypothetical protein